MLRSSSRAPYVSSFGVKKDIAGLGHKGADQEEGTEMYRSCDGELQTAAPFSVDVQH